MAYRAVKVSDLRPGDAFFSSLVQHSRGLALCVGTSSYLSKDDQDCRHVQFLEQMKLRSLWVTHDYMVEVP